MNLWKQKLDAYLHDSPEKVLDLAWHEKRADEYASAHPVAEIDEYFTGCDHASAAADRLPWPTCSHLNGSAGAWKLSASAPRLTLAGFPSAESPHRFRKQRPKPQRSQR